MEIAEIPNNGPIVAEIPDPHPLLQQFVLSRTLEYLKADGKILLSCRRVHPEWRDSLTAFNSSFPPIYLKNTATTNVHKLRRLLSNPHVTLTCAKLQLGRDVDLSSLSVMSFMQEHGTHIRRIASLAPISDLSFVTLLHDCPNLRELEIDPMQIRGQEIMSHHLWDNPLPPLNSLTIHTNKDTFAEWEDKVFEIEDEDDLALEADLCLEIPFDFTLLLLTKVSTIDSLKVKSPCKKFWEKIVTRLAKQPKILQRVQKVLLNFEKLGRFEQANIWTPQLNLKILEVTDPAGINSEEFSTLLANVSGTLETLTVQKEVHRCENHRRCKINLIFHTEMTALKDILIVSTLENGIDCKASGNLNLFEKLPKLRSYQTKTVRPWEEETWRKVFPPLSVSRSQSNRFTHANLRELCIDCIIPGREFLQELKRRFPQVKKLSLAVEGRMLQDIAEELWDSKVQQLGVTYYETEEGFDEFSSAFTGLSILDCKRYSNKKGKRMEIKKVNRSFADWPILRNLMIEYKVSEEHFDDEEFVPLTNVCAKEGFTKLTQLERLTLKNFEIHLTHVSHVLNKIPLIHFDLNESEVDIWDWVGTMADKLEAIGIGMDDLRIRFPKVSLIYDELLEPDDELDFEDEEL